MRIPVARLSVLVLLAVAGCDGHARLLYLKPPHAPKPPWSVSSVVIPTSGDEDIYAIVDGVALQLGMTRMDPASGVRWRVPTTDRYTFSINVDQHEKGYWRVFLLDWPTIARSEQSARAERLIREALRP